MFASQFLSRYQSFALLVVMAVAPNCHAADIINVEQMVNPSSFGGTIVAVSADGRTVVGTKGYYGFRWRQDSGVEYFGNTIIRADVKAVSDDGSKVYVQRYGLYSRVGYWSTGMSDVYLPPPQDRVVGEIIVGASGNSWYGQVITNYLGGGKGVNRWI